MIQYEHFLPSRRLLVTGGSGFIGSAFCLERARQGDFVLNLDLKAPSWEMPNVATRICDVRDQVNVVKLVEEFQPTEIIHLAARTDMAGRTEQEYCTNTQGVSAIVSAARESARLKRLVVASSMLVCEPGYKPSGSHDFKPNSAYGQSKVRTEEITRSLGAGLPWVIVRPTTIWGEGHAGMRDGIFRVLRKGLYRHPRCGPVMRSYGYIRNVVDQLGAAIDVRQSEVVESVFYLGDDAIDLKEWVDRFAVGLCGKAAAVAPRGFMKGLAIVGDIAALVGVTFPMSSYRLKNMTEDNVIDMSETHCRLGRGAVGISGGVCNTLDWLEKSWQSSVGDGLSGVQKAAA